MADDYIPRGDADRIFQAGHDARRRGNFDEALGHYRQASRLYEDAAGKLGAGEGTDAITARRQAAQEAIKDMFDARELVARKSVLEAQASVLDIQRELLDASFLLNQAALADLRPRLKRVNANLAAAQRQMHETLQSNDFWSRAWETDVVPSAIAYRTETGITPKEPSIGWWGGRERAASRAWKDLFTARRKIKEAFAQGDYARAQRMYERDYSSAFWRLSRLGDTEKGAEFLKGIDKHLVDEQNRIRVGDKNGLGPIELRNLELTASWRAGTRPGSALSFGKTVVSDLWKCPKCGTILKKGMAAQTMAPFARISGYATCGACGATLAAAEVYGGKYDVTDQRSSFP